MPSAVRGTHHYTSGVGGAQEDFDFHARLLGLRFLKQTGLYEGTVPIYHLYYGNADGDPGTVLTTFPMRQQGVTGQLGTDQITRLNLSVPRESLGFWTDRLDCAGVESATVERYGTERLHFAHPCGLPYALVADGYGDPAKAWERNGVPAEHAILGSHGITVNVSVPDGMVAYLETGIGGVEDGVDITGRRWCLGVEPHRVGYVELVEDRDSSPGTRFVGEGTIHHCAWDVGESDVQLAVKRRLEGQGYDDWFGPLDRGYFISVYNRTPSGALFEYAYSKPESWAIDEPVDQLGQTFKVPPNLTAQREEILDALESLDVSVPVVPTASEP
jgi:glyoxalase family protein